MKKSKNLKIDTSALSGPDRDLIKIGGKPIKLPKKILKRPKESYRPLHRK